MLLINSCYASLEIAQLLPLVLEFTYSVITHSLLPRGDSSPGTGSG